MDSVIRAEHAVYRYDSLIWADGAAMPLRDYRLKEGQFLIVKNTPWFSSAPVLLHGFAQKTVAELARAAALAALPADVGNALAALQTQITQTGQIAPKSRRCPWPLTTGPR